VSQAATDFGTTNADAYDPTSSTTSMASGGTTPDFSIQVPVSDAKGTQQTMQLDLLKSSVPNQCYAELVSGSVTGDGVPTNQVAAGIIAFTPTGAFDPTNSTFLVPGNTGLGTETLSTYYGAGSTAAANPSLTIGASSAGTPTTPGAVNWSSTLGDAAQTISFNLSGLSQFDSPSTVQSIAANGSVFGNLSNVEVGSDGSVTAVFDNGVTREVAQVALATVPNADGMTAAPGNAYTISNESGTATLKTPGTGGAGTIQSDSLEASTVDLSTEFTNLIQTQQAYSAASKIITTADQMLTDLLNVIQA
jgi:flagellar hook protein FlgE